MTSSKIIYRRLTGAYGQPLTMINDLGNVTTFSDYLVYSAFIEGASQMRSRGVDISIFDEDGQLLVGDFSDKSLRVVAE